MHSTVDVPTDLGRIHVTVVGDGPPVVAWHSLFVDSTSWGRVVPDLTRTHTLFLVDAPSYGDSDPLRCPTSIESCSAAAVSIAAAVREQCGVDRVDWMGNAWGGHVGMVLAATRPDLVRSLVAISAPTHPIDAGLRRKISMLLPLYRLVGPCGPVRSAIEETLFTDATRVHDPEAIALCRRAIARVGRAAVVDSVRTAALNRTDLADVARRIACPVLFLTTDDRGEWTPEQARDRARHMTDAREVTIHGARVIPALERPEAVVSAVRAFWDSI